MNNESPPSMTITICNPLNRFYYNMVCTVHFFMMFPKELTRIFFLRVSSVGDHFLYSLDLYVKFQGWDGKEKLNASHWRVKGLINALSNKQVTNTKITILLGSLQCKRLIRASYRYKLAIVYPIGHVWFGVRVNGGGKKGGRTTHPSTYFWPSTDSLIQISFSPQSSAVIKIKDDGHNFC